MNPQFPLPPGMKFLIVVRHADYDKATLALTEDGRHDMEDLAQSIHDHIGLESTGKVAILASPAKRTDESAEIVARVIAPNTKPVQHEVLLSEDGNVADFAKALEIVLEAGTQAEVVIMVTHHEYCVDFPAYFGVRVLGEEFARKPLGNAEGCIINCPEKHAVKC